MRSVLGSVGSRRRSTTSTALLKRFRFWSTRVCGHTLPLVAMHLLDRSCVIVGKFFEILRSPTVASEPGLCLDVICTVEHKELWAIIVILLTSMSYFDSAVLLDEATQTDIT